MKSAPCKDCLDRHYACHDTCPHYKAFKDHNQRVSENRLRILHEEEYEIKKHARLKKIADNKKGKR